MQGEKGNNQLVFTVTLRVQSTLRKVVVLLKQMDYTSLWWQHLIPIRNKQHKRAFQERQRPHWQESVSCGGGATSSSCSTWNVLLCADRAEEAQTNGGVSSHEAAQRHVFLFCLEFVNRRLQKTSLPKGRSLISILLLQAMWFDEDKAEYK